jgi:myo-inositol-1(or 4)-monophosphatase
MNLKNICEKTKKVLYTCGTFIKEEKNKLQGTDIRFKDKNDLVSYVDIQAEDFLKKEFLKITPGVSFLAEESYKESKPDRSFCWIIDPLDGTTNYIHSLPIYSISVALMLENNIEAALVYEINNDEMFHTYKGSGTFLNNKAVRVSANTMLEKSLLATGFPFKDFEVLENYISVFKVLMKKTRGLRRLGSAAVDLAYVACGRFDGFYEYNLSPWDVAAGAMLIENAGGKVSDLQGGDNFLFGKEILAANLPIHEQMQEIIMKTLDHE